MDRVSVAEAARRLGISQDAVYKRIKRGSIPWDKGEDDKTYVWIDAVDGSTDRARPSTDQPFGSSNYVSKDELFAEMRARVRFLEEELQRKDAILMTMAQRIPELEAPKEASSEPRESSETVSESPTASREEWPLGHEGETYGTSAQEAEESLHRHRKRSWWRQFFGLD